MKTARRFSGPLAVAAVLLFGSGHAAERVVPQLPGPGQRIRVIIDTDAACEIDDLYAIALAVLCPERFQIEGFVGAHFADAGGPTGIARSVQAVQTVLEKAGMAGRFPIKPGSHPLQYSSVPQESEGVDFIIEQAFSSQQKGPLWIISLGACTDVVCAYLKRPEIAERVVVFWHGRTRWPDVAWNFNVYNDLKAARVLLKSKLPLVLFDTGTYLRYPMEESERTIRPYGELGRYLHDFRKRNKWYQSPTKGFFDLGDVAALVDPALTYWETVDAPDINWDMRYDRSKTFGKIVRIYQIDRNGTFQLLSNKLAEDYPPDE